jgi:hypothetical protein
VGKSRGAVGKFRLYRWKLYHNVRMNGIWVTMNMNTRAGTSGTRRIHDPASGRLARALATFGAESTTLTIEAVLSDESGGPGNDESDGPSK